LERVAGDPDKRNRTGKSRLHSAATGWSPATLGPLRRRGHGVADTVFAFRASDRTREPFHLKNRFHVLPVGAGFYIGAQRHFKLEGVLHAFFYQERGLGFGTGIDLENQFVVHLQHQDYFI